MFPYSRLFSFFGFAGAAAALIFSNLGAAYGTAKAGYVGRGLFTIFSLLPTDKKRDGAHVLTPFAHETAFLLTAVSELRPWVC